MPLNVRIPGKPHRVGEVAVSGEKKEMEITVEALHGGEGIPRHSVGRRVTSTS